MYMALCGGIRRSKSPRVISTLVMQLHAHV